MSTTTIQMGGKLHFTFLGMKQELLATSENWYTWVASVAPISVGSWHFYLLKPWYFSIQVQTSDFVIPSSNTVIFELLYILKYVLSYEKLLSFYFF